MGLVCGYCVNNLPAFNQLLKMYYHSTFVLFLAVGLNCSQSHSAGSSRKSNANNNVFNLLLGLYKINPLKGSPVFQSFSNDLLLGMGRGNKGRVVLNSESGESVILNNQLKTNLNEIEKLIHTKNKKSATHFERPAYDLDDVVSTENFKAEFVINDKVLSKEEFQRSLLDNHNLKEDFSSLFDHIGSDEADIEMPVTKLLPVNDTIVRYSQVSKRNEAVFGLAVNKSESRNQIEMLLKTRDRNPGEILTDNFIEGLEDVMVF